MAIVPTCLLESDDFSLKFFEKTKAAISFVVVAYDMKEIARIKKLRFPVSG